ncbi:Adenine phosphoribosyltransferase [hydrothermal vent metagenome]|uniref:adenine phosphoribosyltransferase n=1 Tax=hydrothermal vent metagenome TaxID=652676 RepID=A0A3B0UFV1_9ZZZZ
MFHVEQKNYKMNLKTFIREVPDFPRKGINFIDITTMLKNPDAFGFVVDSIFNKFKDKNITKVVSLESRGFIIGGAVAYRLNAGFVPVRKSGKLPAETFSKQYELEYGTDLIEIHKDALDENDVVLIHDDLLATGGTAMAAIELVKELKVKQIYLSFICNLGFLKTRKKDEIEQYNAHILVTY